MFPTVIDPVVTSPNNVAAVAAPVFVTIESILGVVNVGDVENTKFVDVVPVAPAAVYPVILLNAVIPAVATPVPPLATKSVPARVIAPVVPVDGVKPVVPAENDETPLADGAAHVGALVTVLYVRIHPFVAEPASRVATPDVPP